MRYLLLILCFFSNSQFLYWENLSKEEQNNIISNDLVNKNILCFIAGDIKIKDNEKSRVLLDTLSHLHSDTGIKALSFYTFNGIVSNSDGYISDMLAIPCLSILLTDTEFILSYFEKNNQLMKSYADILGSEFFFKEDGTSSLKYNYNEFKKILDNKLCNKSEYIKTKFSLYKEIEISMKKMQ